MACEVLCIGIHFCLCAGSLQTPESLHVVDINSMIEIQKKILQRKIRRDSSQLMDQYATLRSRTQRYLLNTNCSVENLLICVMDVQHVKCLASQGPLVKLENATTVSGVFLELVKRNLISFLQFSIIKRIVKDVCTECAELQEMLRVYEANFDAYIRRRVCETEAYEEGRVEGFTPRDSEERVELVIVTDENWNGNTEFLRLLDLEAIVAECLDIDDFILKRKSIESNCLTIRYSISVHIAQAVFPLTNEEWRKLAHHGIVKLECLDYLYTTEAKGTYVCTSFVCVDLNSILIWELTLLEICDEHVKTEILICDRDIDLTCICFWWVG